MTLLSISLLKTQVRTVNKCATSERGTQRVGCAAWCTGTEANSRFLI